MACLLSYLYSYISTFIMYCLRHLLLFTCKQGVYKHVNMTSLFPLQKPTYPQSFMLIYGFLFELWVLNLKEEEEEEKKKKKKMKNSAHHSPIHL